MLQLDKPLAIFDLEATGTDIASDRIVEIAIVKHMPDGSRFTYEKRVNPEMMIPEEASNIHGITNRDVATEPTFEQLAPEIVDFLEGCDLGGFNSNNYDIPMLVEEFHRANVAFDLNDRRCVDVQVIFHKMEQRTLAAAYQFYCNKNLDNAHSALADAEATLEVLLAQSDRYDTLPNDTQGLHEFSRVHNRLDFAGRFVENKNGEAIFNFGKHKGKKVEDVLRREQGYYNWMMDANFTANTKQVLKRIKETMDS